LLGLAEGAEGLGEVVEAHGDMRVVAVSQPLAHGQRLAVQVAGLLVVAQPVAGVCQVVQGHRGPGIVALLQLAEHGQRSGVWRPDPGGASVWRGRCHGCARPDQIRIVARNMPLPWRSAMPLDHHDSARSRIELQRVQRQLGTWQRERAKLEGQVKAMKEERKELEKTFKEIESACRQVLRPARARAQLEQHNEQLRRALSKIDRACNKALLQLQRSR
jgi:hypothetical protein